MITVLGGHLVRKAKITLVLGLIVIAFMSVCPPWVKTFTVYSTSTRPLGYSLIFSPPEIEKPTDRRYGVEIDIGRLASQIIAVGCITGIGVIFFNRKRSANKNKTTKEAD